MAGIREKFRGPSGENGKGGLRRRMEEKERERKQEEEQGQEEKGKDRPKTLAERLRVAEEKREQEELDQARQALIDAFKAKQADEMAKRCRIPGQEG